MISIVLLFFVYVAIINVIYPGDAVFGSLSTVFGSGSSQSINGRWVSDVYSDSPDLNGLSMGADDQLAIYFSGGKAYSGNASFDNSELVSGDADFVATYSVSDGKINFTSSGQSFSCQYDGTYIYMNGSKLHRADD